MLSKITISNVASFKRPVTLESSKKVNLIYGLNGSGKSTISNLLYDPGNSIFSSCSIEGLDQDTEVLVYNQSFINDFFFKKEEISGIFTLSKENKEAEEKIKQITDHINKIQSEKRPLQDRLSEIIAEKSNILNSSRDYVWKIKTDYTGGDRVLDYCFEGLRKKENLFNHLLGLPKSKTPPQKTVSEIKTEITSLIGSESQAYDPYHPISFTAERIECHPIFNKAIIGNTDSTVSELIDKLQNSDWVHQGLRFIETDNTSDLQVCPFCQQKTITSGLIEAITEYFDQSYKNDLKTLESLLTEYSALKDRLPSWDSFKGNPFFTKNEAILNAVYTQMVSIINTNIGQIREKIKSPSSSISLTITSGRLENFNRELNAINEEIHIHNEKLRKKAETLESIKNEFWTLMRSQFDSELQTYQRNIQENEEKWNHTTAAITKIEQQIASLEGDLKAEQKKTVNIREAIDAINSGLVDLGIDSFTIEHYHGNFYRLSRRNDSENTFHSLSEGEKMIISFLYFVELCKGKSDPAQALKKKIVVIDDPISSLSHIFIFNVAQLIKTHFSNPESRYEQIFILTHSLYFFYDLTFMHKDDRDKYQNLFRLTKNEKGSSLQAMKYTEIQNDYQSYWQVIKDTEQTPALIANCMRNVIEYFFNFTEKQELSNVFQKPSLRDPKYQAFYRYINRESHSFGQNIFDLKEFDYSIFTQAFKLVFEETGYSKHYEKMMRA